MTRLAFLTASAAGVVLSIRVASGGPILATRWSLLWELSAWAVVWLIGVAAALRLPGRHAVAAVLAVGVLLRLGALAGPPTTSDDLYRYSWDGRAQAASIDPYAYPPNSAHLVALRDAWLWPDAAGCARLHRPVGCTRINRPGQRTIYPPVAEAWFAAVYRVAGIGARAKAWQVAGLLTELGVLGLLPVTLRRWGRDPRWAALYAMSPVPVLEIVNNGHVDGLAVLFAVAALAVLAGGDRHATARDVLAGVLIGAAALVKLYPGVLLIGIAGLGGRRWASLARASASASVLAVVTYLPHVARVGVHVLGYLPGYLAEEHYTTGGRFLLVAALHLPPGLGGALGGIAVGAACLGVCWRRAPPALGTTVIVGAVLLASTPVQPWYAVLLLALGTVAVRPEWTGVALAGYPYFFAVILASRHAAIVGETAYGVAATTVIVVAALRGSRSWTSRRRVETPADGASIPRAA